MDSQSSHPSGPFFISDYWVGGGNIYICICIQKEGKVGRLFTETSIERVN